MFAFIQVKSKWGLSNWKYGAVKKYSFPQFGNPERKFSAATWTDSHSFKNTKKIFKNPALLTSLGACFLFSMEPKGHLKQEQHEKKQKTYTKC